MPDENNTTNPNAKPDPNDILDQLATMAGVLMNYPIDRLRMFLLAIRAFLGMLVQMPEIDVTYLIRTKKLSTYLRMVVRAIRAKLRDRLTEDQKKEIRLHAAEATLLDKTYYRTFFESAPDLLKGLLQVITGKDNIQFVRVETEADYSRTDGSKGAILDLVAWDTERTVYDTEAQQEAIHAPIGRVVHYVDTLGVHSLGAGQDYSENPEVWSIFICKNDPFGDGKLLYQEQYGRIPGTDRYLRNYAYLNCAYVAKASPEKNGELKKQEELLLPYIHDFCQSDPKKMNIKEFREHAIDLKTPDEGGDSELDKAFEDFVAEQTRNAEAHGIQLGKEQGIEIGRGLGEKRASEAADNAAAEKERKQFAIMLKMVGKPVTEEDIRDLLDLTEEQYEEYKSTVAV